MRFPCVHAAATTPVQQLGVVLAHSHPAVSAFPERGIGSACTSSFSRIARRSLTLRPAHSRGHLFVTRYPKASDISSPPCLLRLLPAGAIAPGGPCSHWKAPPCHGAPPERSLPPGASNGEVGWRAGHRHHDTPVGPRSGRRRWPEDRITSIQFSTNMLTGGAHRRPGFPLEFLPRSWGRHRPATPCHGSWKVREAFRKGYSYLWHQVRKRNPADAPP